MDIKIDYLANTATVVLTPQQFMKLHKLIIEDHNAEHILVETGMADIVPDCAFVNAWYDAAQKADKELTPSH